MSCPISSEIEKETKVKLTSPAKQETSSPVVSIAGILSPKTVLEMEALAGDSSSMQTGLTSETETESEASIPVAAKGGSPSLGEETETLATQEVLQANEGRIGSTPEKFAAVEASPSVVEKEEILPAVVAKMADLSPAGIKEEASMPETFARKQDAVPMVAEVLHDKTPVKIVVRVRSFLKVRSEPSLEGKVVGRLKNNDIRVLVNEVEGWYKVEHIDGRTGWISQRYSHKVDNGSSILHKIPVYRQVASLP